MASVVVTFLVPHSIQFPVINCLGRLHSLFALDWQKCLLVILCGSTSFPQYWQTEPGKHGRAQTKKIVGKAAKNVKLSTSKYGQTKPGKHRRIRTETITVKVSMGCVNVSSDRCVSKYLGH